MKRSNDQWRAEGQAIVLVALVLVILVALTGLGIDGANAFAQRRNANIAADAAAMAGARALLDGNLNSAHRHNSNVYDAIDLYLTTHLPGGGGISSVTWQAYYIGQNGLKVGSAIPRDSNWSATVDMYSLNPDSIRGISLDVHYTFNTYFMQILGRDTLNVQAYGLALVGALGGASGADIVPLAIRVYAASEWANRPTGERWDIDMFNSTPSLTDFSASPRPIIGTVDLRQMTLKPDGAAPTLGSGSNNCDSYDVSSPEDSLKYWWCKGSPHRLVSNITQQTTAMPLASSLRAEVQWHIDNSDRSVVLFPVYENEGSPTASLKNIRGFIAIKLISINGTKVKGEVVDFYSAPGPITGNTSGFFGSYAINLVQ
jgi:hypothetical protein